jgi:hypothetical protein|nr:MAG TPA: hypothetical protein [Caudoviricetes sp.]
MKLYVYFLINQYDKFPEFRVEELEVEEKPKTYVIKGDLPKGIYTSRVRKEDIGCFIDRYGEKVFLKSPDLAKAKEIFLKKYDYRILNLKKSIEKEELVRKIISEFEEDTKC